MTTADQLAEIEARLTADEAEYTSGDGDQTIRDRRALLALVREERARIDRVRDLANSAGRCGWRISADDIRKTLAATEGA